MTSPYEKLHQHLQKIRVELDPDPSSTDLRSLFAEIRKHRNMVAKIIGQVIPRLVEERAALLRLERVIDAVASDKRDKGEGFIGCTNEVQRKARLRVLQSEDYDKRVDVRVRLMYAEELVAHAKLVREELRFAFEEASRSLASLDMEYRIERSAP